MLILSGTCPVSWISNTGMDEWLLLLRASYNMELKFHYGLSREGTMSREATSQIGHTHTSDTKRKYVYVTPVDPHVQSHIFLHICDSAPHFAPLSFQSYSYQIPVHSASSEEMTQGDSFFHDLSIFPLTLCANVWKQISQGQPVFKLSESSIVHWKIKKLDTTIPVHIFFSFLSF